MTMKFGGSFAPPLSDETLAAYKTLAEELPVDSPTRDAMLKLHACCSQWWELPESTGTITQARKHASGVGNIIDLDDEHKKALWEAIPWEHELEAYKKLFNKLELDAENRNIRKLESWRAALKKALMDKHFTAEERAWLGSNARKMLRACLVSVGNFDNGDKYIDAIIGAFGPGMNSQTMKDHAAKMKALEAEFLEMNRGTKEPLVGRPQLESTALRKAAKHLLWVAVELDRDREPLTNDKL